MPDSIATMVDGCKGVLDWKPTNFSLTAGAVDCAFREIVIKIVKARTDNSLLTDRNMGIQVRLSLFGSRQLNWYIPLCLGGFSMVLFCQ